MLGNVIFFENVQISKDDIYNSLFLPSNILDESNKQCLEIIFGSLCIVTRRMLDDHLEDGKYSSPSQQLMKETLSVSTTNNVVERNFGILDRFMREKPDGNMITYEAIIMSRTNKTPEWRKKLTPEKRSLMMKWARESVSKQYQDFKHKRMEIRKAKNEKRLDKTEEAQKRNQEQANERALCTKKSKHSGLWLMEEQIETKLVEMETDSEKRATLQLFLYAQAITKNFFSFCRGSSKVCERVN